jgi:hypothetical protein
VDNKPDRVRLLKDNDVQHLTMEVKFEAVTLQVELRRRRTPHWLDRGRRRTRRYGWWNRATKSRDPQDRTDDTKQRPLG